MKGVEVAPLIFNETYDQIDFEGGLSDSVLLSIGNETTYIVRVGVGVRKIT